MLIYAGVDESGYGPLFGPLVVARTVFAVEGCAPGEPAPCLWRTLGGVVCRRAGDGRRRIAVNDSKLLYSSTTGPGHLERAVLAFLLGLGHRPASLESLLCTIGYDEDSRRLLRHWYFDSGEGPDLPMAADPDELPRLAARLARAGERAGVRLLDICAAVVFEDRFNRLVGQSRSKAACNWGFFGGHLRAIWERWGESAPHVIVDRQGGRRDYGLQLAGLFPEAEVEVLRQEARTSVYRIVAAAAAAAPPAAPAAATLGGPAPPLAPARTMTVTVQVDSEQAHLPAALASMTAKYVREMLMLRFRAWWLRTAPGVRPTYGYYGDGRRFLKEIEAELVRLGIEREVLVRCC